MITMNRIPQVQGRESCYTSAQASLASDICRLDAALRRFERAKLVVVRQLVFLVIGRSLSRLGHRRPFFRRLAARFMVLLTFPATLLSSQFFGCLPLLMEPPSGLTLDVVRKHVVEQ